MEHLLKRLSSVPPAFTQKTNDTYSSSGSRSQKSSPTSSTSSSQWLTAMELSNMTWTVTKSPTLSRWWSTSWVTQLTHYASWFTRIGPTILPSRSAKRWNKPYLHSYSLWASRQRWGQRSLQNSKSLTSKRTWRQSVTAVITVVRRNYWTGTKRARRSSASWARSRSASRPSCTSWNNDLYISIRNFLWNSNLFQSLVRCGSNAPSTARTISFPLWRPTSWGS